MYDKKLIYFIFICFLKQILSSVIIVEATNEVITYCDNGFYFLDIKVNYSAPFDKIYNFYITLEDPLQLQFKCFMSNSNNFIKCSLNLNANQYFINRTEVVKMPNIFPTIKGIIWSYDSFVKYIYEKQLVIKYSCKPKDIKSVLNNLHTDQWGFIYKINSIYNNICSYATDVEQNTYVFHMQLEVSDGLLKKELEEINNDKTSTGFSEIEFLQDIWVPLLIGDNASIDTFVKNKDYSFAFCITKTKITNLNLNTIINEGLLFECHIPIPQEQLMSGIIQIKPFYDQIYLRIKDSKSNNNDIFSTFIFININRTIEIIDNKDGKTFLNRRLRKIDEINNNTEIDNKNDTKNNDDKKNDNNNNIKNKTISNNETKKLTTIDYFLIGDNTKKIYCPDKPIFAIKTKRDILIQSSSEKNYTFILQGKLSFKHQIQKNIQENNISYFTQQIPENITFNLQVTDNLAENEDNQKTIVNCIIPNLAENYKQITHFIYCYGNKISEESMERNDTDITLNWAIDKNRIHENIVIKWPSVKKKRFKNMYSYTIKAFSLSQKNNGCFNDGYYFYIYIYDLKYEPNILFEVKMKNPEFPKAECKIHESSILKCFFPLYKERIIKNTLITLPTNVTYNITNLQGNRIIFIVDEYEYDYEDFHLKVKETCGDYAVVGALRRAGLSYFMIIMGVVGIGAFIFVILICCICYIKYKLDHRNRKGQYFAHIEEDFSGMKGKIVPSEKNKNIL